MSTVGDDAEHEPHRHGPQRDVDRVHRIEAVERQVNQIGEHSERRQALRSAATAHLAGHEAAEDHGQAAEQRGKNANREQRVPEQRAHAAEDRDRQGRMVDEPPVEPIDAVEVVQLVAHVAPCECCREQVHGDLDQREADQKPPGGGRACGRLHEPPLGRDGRDFG